MIDIIIPTYKPEYFLIDCFLSIEKQTISNEKFRVTVVLNGDKEPYYSNIKKILGDFSFHHYLIYTEKKGVSNARNLGLENTRNPYVVFLDDDDILSENYLESLSQLVKPNSIVVSNVLGFFEKKEKPVGDYLSFDHSFQSENLVKYRKYLSNSCCKLIPREVIGNNQFNTEIFRGEDALFMFSISHRILEIISTQSDAVYFRRLRPYSASRTKYSMLKEIEIGFKQQWQYTYIYIGNLKKYSFFLYMSRILAVFKVILMKIKG